MNFFLLFSIVSFHSGYLFVSTAPLHFCANKGVIRSCFIITQHRSVGRICSCWFTSSEFPDRRLDLMQTSCGLVKSENPYCCWPRVKNLEFHNIFIFVVSPSRKFPYIWVPNLDHYFLLVKSIIYRIGLHARRPEAVTQMD